MQRSKQEVTKSVSLAKKIANKSMKCIQSPEEFDQSAEKFICSGSS